MVVVCPNCHSKFNLKDASFIKKPVKMRCSVCSHVFPYTPENEPTLEEEFDSLISSRKESSAEGIEQEESFEDFGAEITETEHKEEFREEEQIDEQQVQPESVIREIDSILGAGEEMGTGQVEKTRKESRRRAPVAAIISVILILLVFAGVALWIMKDKIPFLQKPAEELQQAVLERGPFFSISEDSLTYELLTNHKEGTVLVIKGVIKKLTSKPLESVMVQARVYGKDNKLIDTRNAYAGIVPDSSELMRQKSDDINILLTAEPRTMGALSSSQDIPFAVAFFGKPALEGTSFQVEVKEFHWR
ncbi:MAG TPA: DUF3426 domain-containing protein [Deltaproteobacteria bacterium]|nr:DUF3426 domain-containing protein [Deltaproteobacteria bacterium]HPR51001.1 DUF3426 domain-containing protein [Deltaproteobacteria bacterium]